MELEELEKEFSNSIESALELPNNQTARLLVGISGKPLELLTRNNKPYLIVNIIDNSGTVGIKIWDRVEETKEYFQSGSVWSIVVQKSTYENNPQLGFVFGNSLEIPIDDLEEEVKLKILDKVARVYKADLSDVKKIIESVAETQRFDIHSVFEYIFGINPDISYGEVLNALDGSPDYSVKGALKVLKDMEFFEDHDSYVRFSGFCHCPAAKGHHGAYIHGLLCHVGAELDMIKGMRSIYENSKSMKTKKVTERLYDFVDFDAIVLTCVIHDFFKTQEYLWDSIGSVDYAHEKGEMLFYHDMQIAFRLQAMPHDDAEIKELLDKVTHGVMRHHGEWADYQPSKMLKTFVESEIFHFVDVLDARIVGAIEG